MAISDLLSKLIELKNQLVVNLRNKGVSADESEKLNTLVPKVLEIETGVDTSDATATAEDIAAGKTAYAKGEKLTGTKEPVVEFVEGADFTGTSDKTGFISSIKKVNIPNGMTKIGDYAFNNCSNLVSITIPDSVTSIGEAAFMVCTSLESITIGNSVTSIGNYAFYGCSSLSNIPNGNNITSIGDYAFQYCNFTNVAIPNSVTSTGSFSFYCCHYLESIIIPVSVTKIGGQSFSLCEKLAHIYYKGTQTQWNAISKGTNWNYKMGSSVSGGTQIHYNYVP